jgi:MazG family protein
VFGDAVARTAADVNRQWERIKADERAEAGSSGADRSALDGISPSMPALAASQEMQERAAALGYDWPDVDGVLDKVAEELAELAQASNQRDRVEEFGDLLLVVVNVARRMGIESEAALRAANDKFRRRFRLVERAVAERGVAMRDLDFAALDELWDAAKMAERAEVAR